MRRAGRIEPGSGGAVLTGQSGFLSPAETAFTNARLSFFVRPFTDGTVTGGTVTGGAFARESLPAVDGVLEAVLNVESVEEAVTAFPLAAAAASGGPAGGISAIPGDGRVSLLAAQASEVASAKETSMIIEKYLFDGASNIGNES
jgi:hypothetical protein